MQYILTQEEYDALRAKQKLELGMQKAKLQKLCTMIADAMPVSVEWINNDKPEPWGCILTADFDHYCDDCPVQEICPHEHKEWSK